MKYFRFFTFILFVIAIVSCDQASSSRPSKGDVKKAIAIEKKTKKKRNTKKPSKTKSIDEYWAAIQKDLNITDQQVLEIKKLKSENNKAIKALRNSKAPDAHAKIVDLNKKMRKQIERILGSDLYKKKLAWDKKNNKDKKK